jgi:transcriptional regulator with XRE-family HTH domain
MEDRKINQQTLAGKAGLSPSSLSEIRRGITAPGIDTLADIANALGVDAWELLVNDEETRRPHSFYSAKGPAGREGGGRQAGKKVRWGKGS